MVCVVYGVWCGVGVCVVCVVYGVCGVVVWWCVVCVCGMCGAHTTPPPPARTYLPARTPPRVSVSLSVYKSKSYHCVCSPRFPYAGEQLEVKVRFMVGVCVKSPCLCLTAPVSEFESVFVSATVVLVSLYLYHSNCLSISYCICLCTCVLVLAFKASGYF